MLKNIILNFEFLEPKSSVIIPCVIQEFADYSQL